MNWKIPEIYRKDYISLFPLVCISIYAIRHEGFKQFHENTHLFFKKCI